jgi:hypothetical protein
MKQLLKASELSVSKKTMLDSADTLAVGCKMQQAV